MKVSQLILLILFAAQTTGKGQAAVNTLNDAHSLYFQFKAPEAYAAFEKTSTDAQVPEADHTIAIIRLARMDWHLYNNPEKAEDRLSEALKIESQRDKVYQSWSRMLTEQGKYDEAMRTARLAINLPSTTHTSLYLSRVYFLKALMGKYVTSSTHSSLNDKDLAELQEGSLLMSSMKEDLPGDIILSDLFLGLSLLMDKRQEAYNAWRSFFRIANETPQSLQESDRLLRSCLIESDQISKENTLMLVKGLGNSGFVKYAVMLCMINKDFKELQSNQYVNDLLKYDSFLRQTRGHTLEFYRLAVAGNGNQKQFDKNLATADKVLWNNLSETNKVSFSEKKFESEILKRFGAIRLSMPANGHYGLHYGHLVMDEKRNVVQYGKSGELRFMSLDHMLSNGYSSWFWDGGAEVGGWAPDKNSILQVRSAYSEDPVRSWHLVSDSVELKKEIDKIVGLATTDEVAAAKNEVVFLPSLARSLSLQARLRLLDSLRTKGLQGPELRIAFISSIETQRIESSIFAHEGRHAIDLGLTPKMNSEDLEFRAKLSEIYFASDPFLSLSAVFSSNMKDGTSHGNANYRVMQGIVAWMKLNTDKINSYDKAKPALLQLEKLTSAQLKKTVREQDPLGK